MYDIHELGEIFYCSFNPDDKNLLRPYVRNRVYNHILKKKSENN